MNIDDIVVATIAEILRENGAKVPTMEPNSRVLHDTGLDSLALAQVVVRLEEKLGKDPFQGGFINFTTIGELSRLYE